MRKSFTVKFCFGLCACLIDLCSLLRTHTHTQYNCNNACEGNRSGFNLIFAHFMQLQIGNPIEIVMRVCSMVYERVYKQNKLQFGLRLRLHLEFDCYRYRQQSVIDCHCLHSLVWCERTNTYWNACEMLRWQSTEPPGWRSCWRTTCRSRRCAAHARTCCNRPLQWACRWTKRKKKKTKTVLVVYM